MLFIVSALAFVGSISGVFGQFVCPAGYKARTSTPKCPNSLASSCKTDSCCTEIDKVRCKDTTSGNRYTRCGTDKIYSAKNSKTEQKNAAPGTEDATYKANCCVGCTATTCADWATKEASLTCETGTVKKQSLSTANPSVSPDLAGGTTCVTPTLAVYRSTCCTITCASNVKTQAEKNAICGISTANEYKYFAGSLASTAVSPVVASASDTDFKTTCCTLCSTMSCANVKLSFSALTCTGVATISTTKSMSPALVECATPTPETFRSACCVTRCNLGGTHAERKTKCGANKAPDSRQDTKFPADDTNAKFITDCCRDCSALTCNDWTSVTCTSGTSWDGTRTLAGGTACAEPTDATKKGACCITPLLCSAWVADASAALPTCFPFIGTLLASFAVVLGVDCL